MPAREDIAPADLRLVLPHLGLIDLADSFGANVVRLAGSALRDIYGCELTGKRFADIDWGLRYAYWRSVHRRLVQGRTAVHGIVRGPIAQREHVTLAWLRLPLSDDGVRVNKLLCCDVALPPQQSCYDASSAVADAWASGAGADRNRFISAL